MATLLGLQMACSTKGAAPVYNRGGGEASGRPISSATSYIVRRGDTLYSIAWRHGIDYHLIAAWNRVKAPHYLIYPGQHLRLRPPPLTKRPGATAARKTKSTAPEVRRRSAAIAKPPAKASVSSPQPVASEPSSPRKAEPKELKLDWRWPTIGEVVQTFSETEPDRKGVRIGGVSGQPVLATEAGRVVYSGSGLVGYGNLVIIKHDHEYLSAYGYNKKLLVKEGDTVARGEQIAHMGSPRNGADSMLHFEIRKEGKPIDPLPLLPRR